MVLGHGHRGTARESNRAQHLCRRSLSKQRMVYIYVPGLIPQPGPHMQNHRFVTNVGYIFYEPNQNWTCLYNTKTICILDLIEYTSVKIEFSHIVISNFPLADLNRVWSLCNSTSSKPKRRNLVKQPMKVSNDPQLQVTSPSKCSMYPKVSSSISIIVNLCGN